MRPAQPNTGGDKFRSDEMKKIYCCIKYLKKALDLDLSSYWVKKELLKQEYQKIVSGERDEDRALVAVLSQPEFRQKVADKIDIDESNNSPLIEFQGFCPSAGSYLYQWEVLQVDIKITYGCVIPTLLPKFVTV